MRLFVPVYTIFAALIASQIRVYMLSEPLASRTSTRSPHVQNAGNVTTTDVHYTVKGKSGFYSIIDRHTSHADWANEIDHIFSFPADLSAGQMTTVITSKYNSFFVQQRLSDGFLAEGGFFQSWDRALNLCGDSNLQTLVDYTQRTHSPTPAPTDSPTAGSGVGGTGHTTAAVTTTAVGHDGTNRGVCQGILTTQQALYAPGTPDASAVNGDLHQTITSALDVSTADQGAQTQTPTVQAAKDIYSACQVKPTEWDTRSNHMKGSKVPVDETMVDGGKCYWTAYNYFLGLPQTGDDAIHMIPVAVARRNISAQCATSSKNMEWLLESHLFLIVSALGATLVYALLNNWFKEMGDYSYNLFNTIMLTAFVGLYIVIITFAGMFIHAYDKIVDHDCVPKTVNALLEDLSAETASSDSMQSSIDTTAKTMAWLTIFLPLGIHILAGIGMMIMSKDAGASVTSKIANAFAGRDRYWNDQGGISYTSVDSFM